MGYCPKCGYSVDSGFKFCPKCGCDLSTSVKKKEFDIRDGVLEKYIGEGGDVVIPKGVRRIRTFAFKGMYNSEDREDIKSITVPEGVKEISGEAFSGCKNMKSITIPASLEIIEYCAFEFCTSLSSIKIANGNKHFYMDGNCLIRRSDKCVLVAFKDFRIPNGVEKIDGYVFMGRDFSSITIPASVKTIGYRTFKDCKNLKSITFPKGMTSISSEAFAGCESLTSIEIPDSVDSLGDNLFDGCKNLKSIKLPKRLYIADSSHMFRNCESLTSITLPEGYEWIRDGEFENCKNLSSIHIPAGVRGITGAAFSGCNLSNITIAQGNKGGYIVKGDCLISTKSKTLIIGTNNSRIPDDGSVEAIGKYAFTGRKGLTEIYIPRSVKQIGHAAFYDCTNLKTVRLPGNCYIEGKVVFPNGCKIIKY